MFDQPDLKAEFTIYTTTPADWKVISCEECEQEVPWNTFNSGIDIIPKFEMQIRHKFSSEIQPDFLYSLGNFVFDDGELDWKVLAIALDDPLAAEYNDIDDVPDAIKDGIREWFRWYKTPDGKALNGFGYDEKFLDAAETKKVIEENNDAWKKLKKDGSEKLWLN